MITLKFYWHFLIPLIIQILIIGRLIYIYKVDPPTGFLGGLWSAYGTILYTIISVALWLIYGGIYWW